MKFVLLSDLHLLVDRPRARLDDAPLTQQKKLYDVLNTARKIGADGVLQAGDFFDIPRSWRLVSKYAQLLRVMKMPVYTVFGQHDTYMYSKETRDTTNLGILARAGLVCPLDGNPLMFDSGTIQVYGCSYGEEVHSPTKMDESRKPLQILVIHRSIVENDLPFSNSTYARPFLRKYPEYDLILCGDAHQKFLVKDQGRIICNTGPLLRREATPEMFSHHPGFYVYDTEERSATWYDLEIAPAERVLTRNHIEKEKQTNEMLDKFIQEILARDADPMKEVSFVDNLIVFLKNNDVENPVRNIISQIMNEE